MDLHWGEEMYCHMAFGYE